MKIVQVDPRVDPIWQTLADRGGSSVFHSPSWIQVLSETYGWEASAYVVLDDRGEPQAGIPFCRIAEDRKSTRLNSSHSQISYAVFCLKKIHSLPARTRPRSPPQ